MGNFCCQDNKEASPEKKKGKKVKRDINTHKRSNVTPDHHDHREKVSPIIKLEETSPILKIDKISSGSKLEELGLKPAKFYKEKIGVPQ